MDKFTITIKRNDCESVTVTTPTDMHISEWRGIFTTMLTWIGFMPDTINRLFADDNYIEAENIDVKKLKNLIFDYGNAVRDVTIQEEEIHKRNIFGKTLLMKHNLVALKYKRDSIMCDILNEINNKKPESYRASCIAK